MTIKELLRRHLFNTVYIDVGYKQAPIAGKEIKREYEDTEDKQGWITNYWEEGDTWTGHVSSGCFLIDMTYDVQYEVQYYPELLADVAFVESCCNVEYCGASWCAPMFMFDHQWLSRIAELIDEQLYG